MKISWIIADGFLNSAVKSEQLKTIGPLWSSWKSWRNWQSDNVLCDNMRHSQELIDRNFHKSCNFYIPEKYYVQLGRPAGVKVYNGNFPAEFDKTEEIISMHLAAENADLVLLLGFNVSVINSSDAYQTHKKINYLNAFRATINTYVDVQWALIDHLSDIDPSLKDKPNLTCDNFESVLKLLN